MASLPESPVRAPLRRPVRTDRPSGDPGTGRRGFYSPNSGRKVRGPPEFACSLLARNERFVHRCRPPRVSTQSHIKQCREAPHAVLGGRCDRARESEHPGVANLIAEEKQFLQIRQRPAVYGLRECDHPARHSRTRGSCHLARFGGAVRFVHCSDPHCNRRKVLHRRRGPRSYRATRGSPAGPPDFPPQIRRIKSSPSGPGTDTQTDGLCEHGRTERILFA